uniref:G_PROTEIN_RECEP_F1_2 domain-containing protein n=1 Tax=Parastrongyloides trichosuri TaxID=131310 RepID=A0A0N4Z064_PARTI
MEHLATNIYFVSIQWVLQLLILTTTIMILMKMETEDFTVRTDPIYDHFNGHQSMEEEIYNSHILSNMTDSNHQRHYNEKPNIWIKTWVEYYLVWQLASSSFAIFSLCLKLAAFKINQSFLVIPNIVSLFIDITINLLGFSVFLACILRIPRYIRFNFSVEILMIYQMAFLLSSACIHLVSLSVTKRFYIALRTSDTTDTSNEVTY